VLAGGKSAPASGSAGRKATGARLAGVRRRSAGMYRPAEPGLNWFAPVLRLEYQSPGLGEMEHRDGFVPSTPWGHCGDLVRMPRSKDAASGRHSRRHACARPAARLDPKWRVPSMTSEANFAVALLHDVELQIEAEAD